MAWSLYKITVVVRGVLRDDAHPERMLPLSFRRCVWNGWYRQKMRRIETAESSRWANMWRIESMHPDAEVIFGSMDVGGETNK